MSSGPAQRPPAAFGDASAPTRQARSTATRARIIDTATAAFVTGGIASVSLRDIAAQAGITHPGLLRHFSSKEALLGAVVEQLDRANTEWIDRFEPGPDSLGFAALAARNATTPGYLELYTALSGEATSPSHPAHEHLRERYARVRSAIAEQLATAPVRPGLAPEAHAALVVAAWDGLQLQQRYDPAVDVVDQLAHYERWLLGLAPADEPSEATTPARRVPPTVIIDDEPPEPTLGASEHAGRIGRERRAQITASAIELFAKGGYHGTSLRELAEHAGMSKATLVHHITSKDELLTAVLRLRDRRTISPEPAGATAVDGLYRLADAADRTARSEPGLIELYAVLSCEGATPGHPAHDYFARRFRGSRRYFGDLFLRLRAEGALRPDRDPVREAAWLLATWDGLQMQWLYDPAIGVGEHLRVHFDDLVVPEARRS